MVDILSILKQLTLEEKVSLCSGLDMWQTKDVPRLKIPSIWFANGNFGVRKEMAAEERDNKTHSYPSTCFPSATALASTWNRKLLRDVGNAIGKECLNQGVHVLLAPSINIKRSPLGGSNFECFSEDPYLTGKLAKEYVIGVQQNNVAAAVKRFAVHNQEYYQFRNDAIVDERALREIYLSAFETVIKEAKPMTILVSSNKINGYYATENRFLLNTILRKKWNYNGVTISDWGAIKNRIEALRSGLNLEMPTSSDVNDNLVMKALRSGRLSIEDVNRSAFNVLKLIYQVKDNKQIDYDYQLSHEIAKKAAVEGAVLLKNEGNLLPLDENEIFNVIGRLAIEPKYQGNSIETINPKNLVSFSEMLTRKHSRFHYERGYELGEDLIDELLLEDAVNTAQNGEVTLVFLGQLARNEATGSDRNNIDLPANQVELLNRLTAVNDNIVVVLMTGAPVAMPWLPNVKAVLQMNLAGETIGEATYDLLFGNASPSGRLAETYPLSLEDNPVNKIFPMGPNYVTYNESIYVGYRYYETAQKEVLFPFGYGLSYADFEYGQLIFDKNQIGTDEQLTVTFTIRNNSNLHADEVIQIYVQSMQSDVFRPIRELKEFAKVSFKPYEQKRISIRLPYSAFMHFNTLAREFIVERGYYGICIGKNVHEAHLRQDIFVEGVKIPRNPEEVNPYFDIMNLTYSNETFSRIISLPEINNELTRAGDFTLNSTISELKNSVVGRLLYRYVYERNYNTLLHVLNEDARDDMTLHYTEGMPLINVVMMSEGKLDYKIALAILDVCNKKKNAVGIIPQLLKMK